MELAFREWSSVLTYWQRPTRKTPVTGLIRTLKADPDRQREYKTMRMILRRAGRRAMYVAEWQKHLDALIGKTMSDRKTACEI